MNRTARRDRGCSFINVVHFYFTIVGYLLIISCKIPILYLLFFHLLFILA
jgi:hypothetical protein